MMGVKKRGFIFGVLVLRIGRKEKDQNKIKPFYFEKKMFVYAKERWPIMLSRISVSMNLRNIRLARTPKLIYRHTNNIQIT